GLNYLNAHIDSLSRKGAQVVVISDACHSGSLAGSEVGGTVATAAQIMRQLTNEVKILSCQPYELAQEDEKWGEGRGAFSYYLVEGLRGDADRDNNQEIDLFELENYLQLKVRDETDRAQHPEITGGNKRVSFFRIDPEAGSRFRQSARRVLRKDFVKEEVAAAPKASQRNYVRFQRALQRGRLLLPEGKSALSYFNALKVDSNLINLRGILQERLTVTLLDSVQQAIRAYLETDANELAQRERLDAKYRQFPRYLGQVAALIGAQDPRYLELLAKQSYFSGLVLRLEGEQAGGVDSLYEQALAHQLSAVKNAREAAYIHNELGLLYLRLRRLEEAEVSFERAMALSPTWALPKNNYASLARRLYAIEYFSFAEFYFLEAIKLKPDFATAYMNYGNGLVAAGRRDTAEVLLRQALKLGPEYADAYHNLAVAIYRQPEKTREAIGLFQEVIRRKPDYLEAYAGLGHAYEQIGELDSAIAVYLQEVALSPGAGFALGRVRELYATNGKSNAARALFLEAIKKAPHEPAAYAQLGLLDSGADDWAKQLRMAPVPMQQKARIARTLAFDFFFADQFELTENAFLLAVDWRAGQAAPYNDLSRFYSRQKQTKKALRAMRKTLQLANAQDRENYCTSFAEEERYLPLQSSKQYRKMMRKYCENQTINTKE
ncbi:MAG: tetratricopeptide repeat protein, partial [Bacteroidota bacterium]